MQNFYLNKIAQNNGDHEIHKEKCRFCDKRKPNFELLSAFSTEREALIKARRKYPSLKIDGCFFCCKNTDTDKFHH